MSIFSCQLAGKIVRELLQTYVTHSAESSPDAVALRLKEERVTYGQLETITNQLARLLRTWAAAEEIGSAFWFQSRPWPSFALFQYSRPTASTCRSMV